MSAFDDEAVSLDAGELLRVQSPRGEVIVTCEAGHVWITEEAQPDDVWLGPGQRVRLVGDGLAILEAKDRTKLRFAHASPRPYHH
jgi:ferric-dicitrate binding protein FerR (iron transport regulator)